MSVWTKDSTVYECGSAGDDALVEREVCYFGPKFLQGGLLLQARNDVTYYVVDTEPSWGVMRMDMTFLAVLGPDNCLVDTRDDDIEYDWANVTCFPSLESATAEMIRLANTDECFALENWRPDMTPKAVTA